MRRNGVWFPKQGFCGLWSLKVKVQIWNYAPFDNHSGVNQTLVKLHETPNMCLVTILEFLKPWFQIQLYLWHRGFRNSKVNETEVCNYRNPSFNEWNFGFRNLVAKLGLVMTKQVGDLTAENWQLRKLNSQAKQALNLVGPF